MHAVVVEKLITSLIKSRMVSWAVHVANVEEIFVKFGETRLADTT
jgi:hypothetical protein